MYKLKDLQGAGLKEDHIFKDKAEVIENLASYHDQDFESEKKDGTPYKDIFELLGEIKSEDEKLDFLLDWGQWELVTFENTSAIIEEIESNIAFAEASDWAKKQTADYIAGYLDGARQVLAMVKGNKK